MVLEDVSPYSPFKIFHQMSNIALLLWVDHTLDHITAYKNCLNGLDFHIISKMTI